ncbi:hypothetical protein QQS45_00600 [Alteriqipengyuania flavescens]|uniref:hypothetical protein n=1 Tax=Alteriqipengyuania flavescens TaxID=3053610 RepID=UPI0025B3D27F|nr:hypothetical protein [Alteriqipengyuania flavescens]WJY18786.1 hypothetical protein QQW98_00600 [Alteriqipengyuania flavescens]WJY24726.1 hypothetical protein QQS45_00600 [Alteriqipengyuania flavescens]
MDTVLSIVAIAAIALLVGAVCAFRAGHRKQAGLMVVLALVMAGNIAIIAAPDASGRSPILDAASDSE